MSNSNTKNHISLVHSTLLLREYKLDQNYILQESQKDLKLDL